MLILGCSASSHDRPKASSYPDLSHVKLKNLENTTIDLKLDSGKIVFINFWATWCGPCIIEMPAIERAQKALGNNDVVFYLASSEPLEEIIKFKKTHAYNFNYVRIENSDELFINVLPTTYIYDRSGKLAYSQIGMMEWDSKDNLNLILNPSNRDK
ncbi:MAG: TlpA family protein disulfide reductase [Flammeovirgaceae bacterium]|nr:TlpA family protein disulfide reductase [Flammeovirgaceae bacterium]